MKLMIIHTVCNDCHFLYCKEKVHSIFWFFFFLTFSWFKASWFTRYYKNASLRWMTILGLQKEPFTKMLHYCSVHGGHNNIILKSTTFWERCPINYIKVIWPIWLSTWGSDLYFTTFATFFSFAKFFANFHQPPSLIILLSSESSLWPYKCQ